MAIAPTDLEDFARRIASGAADEVTVRAAISRAYYAAFHYLFDIAAALPKSAKCPDYVTELTHHEMQCRFDEWQLDVVAPGLSSNRILRDQLTASLKTVRKLRIKADYRLGSDMTLADATMQLARVGRLKRAADEIRQLGAASSPA